MTNDIISQLPDMLAGNELLSALSVFPDYDDAVRYDGMTARLMRLSDLYNLYIADGMSIEIYSKLYLSLVHSLQKKGSKQAVIQSNLNFKRIHKLKVQTSSFDSIMGSIDSFTIIGTSGIGKSSAISRAINVIAGDNLLIMQKPYFCKVIPFVLVQCPFDSSPKGLLLTILRSVDMVLDTDYYTSAIRKRETMDTLIGVISQVALNHIGVLVIDEVQNVVGSKNGRLLIEMLITLINSSGVSICFVGTPDCESFFSENMALARRCSGLRYGVMQFDNSFENFCKLVYGYQYTQTKTTINNAIVSWLYQHSAGVKAIVIQLIHDAQEIAILTGKEIVNTEIFNDVYRQRLSLLHNHIQPTIEIRGQTDNSKKKNPAAKIAEKESDTNITLDALFNQANQDKIDIVKLLTGYICVVILNNETLSSY